jgi:4-hydroxyphenylacetate 3-monooxygenase
MNHLLTGAEYLESLRDGRNVYVQGEKVTDVTKHPAFRNCALSVSRMYDALHAPRSKDCGSNDRSRRVRHSHP